MSADNGWLVRRASGKGYVVHHYTASADEYPAVDDERGTHFQDLEAAILYANQKDLEWPSEYGVRVLLVEQKQPQYVCGGCLSRVLGAQTKIAKVRALTIFEPEECRCGFSAYFLLEWLDDNG